METLYHITTRGEADAARASGTYEPAGFAREGFVHASFRGQVAATANRLFAGRDDLVLLVIDPAKLAAEVVCENLEGGRELFPHVYGRIPWEAVHEVRAFPCASDGTFAFPSVT